MQVASTRPVNIQSLSIPGINPSPLIPLPIVESEDWEEDADRADMIDVSALHDMTGDLERSGHIAFAFRLAGFNVKKVEKAPYHPVWIVLLANQIPHFYNGSGCIDHVRQILRTAGVTIRKKDIMIERTRTRILISFVLAPPATTRTKKSRLRRLLAELP